VRLEHVRKEYGPVHALDGVSLEILPGEVHCLAGENGAGKSTLIRVLSGATARDGGSYEVLGREVPVAMAPSEARELGIGVVYQELSLLPELSVMDNLFMGHFRHRAGVISRRRQRQEAREILDGVGLDAVSLDDLVGDLPTATRQMIEIARVLAAKARLVVFDEPTTALSEREAAALLERIQMLGSNGTAVLYVTHRLEEMFEIGDRVTVLRDGRSVSTHAMADLDESALIAAMVGREVTDLYPGQRPEPGPVRLKVSGLVPQGFEKPVDFEVRQGEIVGLAGLLGAGRTEILRAVFGAEPAESGAVEIDGATVTIRSPRAAVRNGIALLTEDRKESGLLAQLSIRENVTIASLDRTLQSGLVSRRLQHERASTAVEGLRLKHGHWDDPITSLSGGNQQKVLLGRWLGTDAKVLLLDEPTKGVDIGAKSDLYRVIARLAEEGLAVVVVSSYLPELLGLCDRIIVVREREISGEVSGPEATEHRVLELASPRRAHANVDALAHEHSPYGTQEQS
jgi:ABC-type sugar transport system ATPase subunit